MKITRTRLRAVAFTVTLFGTTLLVPAFAGAATISYAAVDHGQILYTAAAAEQLNTVVKYEAGCLSGPPSYDCVVFAGDTVTSYPNQCTQEVGGISCLLSAGDEGVKVMGGEAADAITFATAGQGGFPADSPYALIADGGGGDDTLRGGSAGETLNGSSGDDTLSGMGGDDVLSGGDGNDTLTGDDSAATASIGHDVLDGGAGSDTVYDDWYRVVGGGQSLDPPPTVTLDGQANDGRPGENDDVLNVETIDTGGQPESDTAGNYIGSSGNDVIRLVFAKGNVTAGDGDDTVSGGSAADTIDGGAGNDSLSGGIGDDSLIGGAGQDLLSGDAGNDVLYAQDGEKDAVDCGPGVDTAYVDAVDAATGCEQLHVTGATTAPAGSTPTTSTPATSTTQTTQTTPTIQQPAALTAPRPTLGVGHLRLRTIVRARALKLACRLVEPGRCAVVVTIAARDARRLHLHVRAKAKTVTLGRATATLTKAGAKTVVVRLRRSIAARLRKAHSLKLRLAATGIYTTGRASVHRTLVVRR